MQQLELESWWVDLYRRNGAAYSQRLRKANRASSDPALRKLINDEAFRIFRRFESEMAKLRSGQRSENATLILKLLESMEGIALAHLIVSAGLNHLLGKLSVKPTLPSVGGSLVRAVETELRIRFVEKVYPNLANAHRKRRGTFTHRNKGLMVLAGRASRSGLPSFFADSGVKSRLTMALVEMLLLGSGIFEPYREIKGRHKVWCIRVKKDVLAVFNRTQNLDDFLSCVPPLGLYMTPQSTSRKESDSNLLSRRPLVSHNWLSGQRGGTTVPDSVVSCIEHLNQVGYRINTEMLAWIKRHEKMLGARGIIPQMELVFRESDDKAKVYDAWNANEMKRRLYRRTILLAERLADSTFYHDWFLDFRGRMYTTSTLLSPQGTPLNKALINFDKRVTIKNLEGPEYWEFANYGARMIWGKGDISNATVSYIGERGYIDAAISGTLSPEQLDDPKDYLPFIAWAIDAHCLLANGAVNTGIMLRRDATASSIQHMATMARDTDLMRLVNLSDTPPHSVSDLYSGLNTGLKRGPLKSFIMTYCYNSTAYGRAKARIMGGESGTLRDFMKEDANVSRQLEPVLAKVAALRDAIVAYGEAHSWKFETPSGISWDGVRYEWPVTLVTVRFNGARLRIKLRTDNGEPDENIRKTRSAFVANVVHSLDASMLHLCRTEWPPSVAFIHDCVCTLPGDMDRTCDALRRSFFKMHEKISDKFSDFYQKGVAIENKLCYDSYIECSKNMFV